MTVVNNIGLTLKDMFNAPVCQINDIHVIIGAPVKVRGSRPDPSTLCLSDAANSPARPGLCFRDCNSEELVSDEGESEFSVGTVGW